MGTRSLAVRVELPDGVLLIDPGAAYAPRRYGLPPHPKELERLEETLNRIRGAMREAEWVVITHYHYDHYLRREPDLYTGKKLLVKDWRRAINRSQAIRAHRLLKTEGVASKAAEVTAADGREIWLPSGARIVFSEPVPHGAPGTPLGWVIMLLIEYDGFRLAYASDTQGPMSGEALDTLLSWEPDMVIISGPPTYHGRVDGRQVEEAMRNLRVLASRCTLVIADHHMARDEAYPRMLEELRGEGLPVTSAAEYEGKPIELLEAWRKRLWGASGAAESETADSD